MRRSIDELSNLIDEAKKNGIDVFETKKLFSLAQVIFNRGDYELALEKLKEAKLTYALETKGEFNLIYAVKNHPGQTTGILFALILFSIGSTLVVKRSLLIKKIRLLDDEEKLLLQLIQVVQKECFVDNKMSMEEYTEAMDQYEKKLQKAIADKIEAKTKLKNLMNIHGKKQALEEEKQRLVELIKKAQADYLNKGKLETRIYDNMVKSYTSRLSKVESKLNFMEAKQVLNSTKRRGVSRLFGSRKY